MIRSSGSTADDSGAGGGLMAFLITDNDNCTDGVQWIYDVFQQCVYTDLQYAAVIMGMIALLCFVCVFFPQIYTSFVEENADEALSIGFLLFWLFGDVTNLVGCILTHQLAIQLWTSIFFVVMDMVLFAQFFYYKRKNARKRALQDGLLEPAHQHQILSIICIYTALSLGTSITGLNFLLPQQNLYSEHRGTGRTLLALHIFIDTSDIIGYVVGIISGLCYLGARFPQLWQNYHRKSVQGVSLLMFVITIVANISYGLSILFVSVEWDFVLRHLPWLVGSLGTLVFDILVIFQFWLYGMSSQQDSENSVPPELIDPCLN